MLFSILVTSVQPVVLNLKVWFQINKLCKTGILSSKESDKTLSDNYSKLYQTKSPQAHFTYDMKLKSKFRG